MLYTSSPPFAGLNPAAVLAHKLLGTSALRLPGDTPAPYKQLFEDCSIADPARRPTFQEVGRRLAAMAGALERGELGGAPEFAACVGGWRLMRAKVCVCIES